jgi:hypothetical protein
MKTRSSPEWVDYFRWNCTVAMRVPWHIGADLSDAERSAIAHSIRVFQLGESSEGRHLIGYAKRWAERSGDCAYLEAIRMLIAEEQRHAGALGRFMDLNGIMRIKRGCTDGVFRRLRNLFGSLEVSIAVLVTAEIIAKVYYPALREATHSTVLRTICELIEREEIIHVEFQTEQLARLRARRREPAIRVTHCLHRLLFYPTIVVVGFSHRPVLRRGGLSMIGFWSRCRREFRDAIRQMDPRERIGADSPRRFAHGWRSATARVGARGKKTRFVDLADL